MMNRDLHGGCRTSPVPSAEPCSRPASRWPVLVFLATALTIFSSVPAETPDLRPIDRRLAELEQHWSSLSTEPRRLRQLRDELDEALARMRACVNERESELQTIDEAVSGLTAEQAGTADVPADEFRAPVEEGLVECRLRVSRLEEWIGRVDRQLARARTDILLEQTPGWTTPGRETRLPWLGAWIWLVIAVAMTLPLAFRRRWPVPWESGSILARGQPIAVSFLSILPAAATLIAAGYFHPDLTPDQGRTLASVAIGLALILGLIDALPPRRKRRGWKHPSLWLLLVALSAGGLLLEMEGWPLPLVDPIPWSSYAAVALLVLLLSWSGLLLSIRRVVELGRVLYLWSNLAIALLLTAAIAWALQRLNLSAFVINGTVGTTMVLLAAHWLYVLVHESLDGLDTGSTSAQRWIRTHLGLQPDEPMAASAWMRVAFDLILFIALLIVLSTVWRLSVLGVRPVTEMLREGVELGQVRIVPYDVVAGLLIFAVLVILTQRTKRIVSDRLVKRGRVSIRSAEPVVTVLGYTGIVLAAILGLTVAGVSFGNLAIVAGALSVGIGFGLQNVVNNFVSGLILLFERPVKAGDLIKVGDAEGIVSRIRVRSTEIQGFDRAEIIVPNSEMISQRVTNLMLHDGVGRIDIKVGVAYGSDVEKVREVLLRVAESHPHVISEGDLAPKVLFWEFGDSSLNFEIRCYLEDVLKRIDTRSELNFAIDRAFREAGIEIPFPQRTVHLPDFPRDKDAS